MSLYSQTVSNNPLSLDGLITGNFDLLYVDGVPITPMDTSGLVPYIGANATVNLNTQNIKSSYVPLLPEDLTNKQYTDTKYLNKAGFNVSSGGFVFDGTSTIYLHGTTNIIVPAVTPTYSLGIDTAGDLIKFTGGTGDAVLSDGTSLSPQIFTGYDKFNNLLKTADIDATGNITASGLTTTNTLKILTTTTTTPLYSLGIMGTGDVVQFTGGTGDAILAGGTLAFPQQFTGYNYFLNLWIGACRFPFGVASGTPTYILGVDTSTGNLVSTAPTSAPTQLTVTNQSTVAGNYYPVYITNTATGIRSVYSMNGAFYEPITQIWEATNIKSAGTTTCVGTLFTQSGITNTAGQFLITDNLRSPNTGMTFIIPSASATFGFQNNTIELAKIDTNGITCSKYNAVYDTTMIFNTSGAVPPASPMEMSFRYNNIPFMTASPNAISITPTIYAYSISGYTGSNLAISAPTTGFVSIQGVQFTTADILTLTSQIFYSSKIYAQSGVNLLYNVNSGYNHNFNVNGVNTCFINGAGLVMTGSKSIEGQVLSSPASTALFITGSTDLNLTATSIVYYGCNTLHSFSVNSVDTLLLNTKGAVIPRSSIGRSNLTDYELIVGNNIATVNSSAKILIRGVSANSSQAPSVDFTGWFSHTTVQGRLTLYDDNNWGGIMATMVKISGSGAAGAMVNVFELSAPTSLIGRMNFKDCAYMDVYCNNTMIVGFARPSTDIPVKIIQSYTVTAGAYWFYYGGTNWAVSGSLAPAISLLAYGVISTNGGFTLASDIRIKKNIQLAENGSLDIIDRIPIKSYDMIDEYRNGKRCSFNIIAQDINEIYPEAITYTRQFIPSVASKCSWIQVDETHIKINMPKPHGLIVGDLIEILLEDMSIKEANVVKIENDFIFIIDKWENFNLEISDEMVIYGKQVDDFQLVDKTKLAMLGLAGTKELHQIVKQQQSQINTQQKTIETLLDHVKRLTEQVNQITLKMV